MINCMVTIYKLNNGEVYLHHYQVSSMGVYLACPPFIKFGKSESCRLPEAIKGLMAFEPEIVPHPKIFNQLEPLYEIAGRSNWKDFAKGTLCFHIEFVDGDIKLTRTKKEGVGFADLPDPVSLGLAVELESLLKVVPELVDK